jgi:hypothetical protein
MDRGKQKRKRIQGGKIKKVYKVPQICLDHYEQYLKATDVDKIKTGGEIKP